MSEEILKKIEFEPNHQGYSFEYDSESGFLRNQDGAYLLFRAEAPGENPSPRARGELDASRLASYGKGLYIGNTPESVAPYIWIRPDNIINAYLTPGLETESIHNHAHLSHVEAARAYMGMVKKRRSLGWRAVSADFDELHGDSLLATRDAGFDILLGQKLLSATKHEVAPRWGIWRGDVADLSRIGTAQANSKPFKWAVKAVQHSSRK